MLVCFFMWQNCSVGEGDVYVVIEDCFNKIYCLNCYRHWIITSGLGGLLCYAGV